MRRRLTLVLWTVTALLLGAGIFASTRQSAAQQLPAADSIAAASGGVARAGEAQVESGPPASGVGAATAPVQVDSQAPVAASAPVAGQAGQAVREAFRQSNTPLSLRLVSVLGMLLLLGIGWALSTDRRSPPWRVIFWGLGLQLLFALLILKTPAGRAAFDAINTVVVQLLAFTNEGARFLFGNLVQNNVPVGSGDPGNGPIVAATGTVANAGAYFAFSVLPTIIFFSSLMTVLYYLGIMQWLVKGMAWVMQRTMRTSGAETLSAAGNIFVGQTEAPLVDQAIRRGHDACPSCMP